MNILVVHNYYKYSGGEDSVFINEVNGLKDCGHKVCTYTRSNSELNNFSLFRKALIPFIYFFNLRTYLDIKKIIEKESIDVVHVHNTLSLISYSVYYAAFHKKIPVLQTVHNFRMVCPNALLFRNNKFCDECVCKNSYAPGVLSGCYHNSKLQTFFLVISLLIHKDIGIFKKINFIFLTNLSAQKFNNFIDLNSNNVFIKGNFINDGYYERSSVQLNNFVFVGRLDKGKGILDLIKSWRTINDTFTLVIYGDGPLQEEVKRMSENNANIIYKGKQSNDVILSELANSCAMIFSSQYFENLPMTIVEAFSVGCPVISYSIGNGEELIRASKGGEIYFDDRTLKECIYNLIDNNTYYSKNAYSYYLDNFGKRKNIDQLINIYELIKK